MELEDYRLNDRVEIRKGGGWVSGQVVAEKGPGFPLQVQPDAGGPPKIVTDAADIRLAGQAVAQSLEAGTRALAARVSLTGPGGLRWTGAIVSENEGGRVTVRLDHLDAQTLIVPRHLVTEA